MLTGGMPFRAENVSKLKKCILEGTYAIPPFVSEHAANLIRAILIGMLGGFKHMSHDIRITLLFGPIICGVLI